MRNRIHRNINYYEYAFYCSASRTLTLLPSSLELNRFPSGQVKLKKSKSTTEERK